MGSISAPARAVLAEVTVEGNLVRLPDRQLDRKLYQEVNEVLTRLGGKWKSGKVRAHVFDASPADDLVEVQRTGDMPQKNPLGFFPTPQWLANELCERAGVRYLRGEQDVRLLEPSAGTGAIMRAMRDFAPDAAIDAVELDAKRAGLLRRAYEDTASVRIFESDFLGWLKVRQYDAIVMNPPFAVESDPLAYIAHIRHAHAMLKPGGRLASVAPISADFRTDKRTREFREWVLAHQGQFHTIREDAFAESGTLVRTCMVMLWAAS